MRLSTRLRLLGAVLVVLTGWLALPSTSFGAPAGAGGATGYDVSFVNCGSNLPKDGAFGIVGVTAGLPWSVNPCLRAEYQWASTRPSPPALYTNTANPGPISPHWRLAGPRACLDYSSHADIGCAYNYGWNAMLQAFSAASSVLSTQVASTRVWWLDVETMNSWNGTTAANAAAVQGYVDYLRSRGVANVGVYSTASQWRQITGGLVLPGLPNWVAGASSLSTAPLYCGASFSGGPTRLVQYSKRGFDVNYACP